MRRAIPVEEPPDGDRRCEYTPSCAAKAAPGPARAVHRTPQDAPKVGLHPNVLSVPFIVMDTQLVATLPPW
jgi:hypothetical protein